MLMVVVSGGGELPRARADPQPGAVPAGRPLGGLLPGLLLPGPHPHRGPLHPRHRGTDFHNILASEIICSLRLVWAGVRTVRAAVLHLYVDIV